MKRINRICIVFLSIIIICTLLPAQQMEQTASLKINAANRSPHKIPAFITGKFCEHLGSNIYKGMYAQILVNPTFAVYQFTTRQNTPDGGAQFIYDFQEISNRIRRQAPGFGWPVSEVTPMIRAYDHGMACWWTREGGEDAVIVSPDNGKYGHRAQRIEVKTAGQGIAQWTYLPLHRVKKYEFEIIVRSPNISSLNVSLTTANTNSPAAETDIKGVSNDWKKIVGTLEIPQKSPANDAYKFCISANQPGQFIIERVLLFPADHIGGADPDVIRMLKESNLPILRWPGGNYVSGYHWEEGIGPANQRPTVPNYHWGRVEPNLFGTDEFIAYCQELECEPMLCVNVGNGTPEEAARWVEYCNGSIDTPMGALRAANGHPKPYNVMYWEIGNEIWGDWQIHWTTASGYVDRFKNFVKLMCNVDPDIKVYAAGAPVIWNQGWDDWNATVIKGTASILKRITVHPLVGGALPPETEPLDVFRDYMAVPNVLEERWGNIEKEMKAAGIQEPKLAVTELQLFARIAPISNRGLPQRLSRRNLVRQSSITEALYNVLVYHAVIRLAPFVEMVTHSATLNHGAGLRKTRERVYAEPAHYAQSAFSSFADATPVKFELKTEDETAPVVLPDLQNVVTSYKYNTLDALAALSSEGDLLVSLVHKGTKGPIQLAIAIDGFRSSEQAELHILTADKPWIGNTLNEADRVKPITTYTNIKDNEINIKIQPYTVMRIRIAKAK